MTTFDRILTKASDACLFFMAGLALVIIAAHALRVLRLITEALS